MPEHLATLPVLGEGADVARLHGAGADVLVIECIAPPPEALGVDKLEAKRVLAPRAQFLALAAEIVLDPEVLAQHVRGPGAPFGPTPQQLDGRRHRGAHARRTLAPHVARGTRSPRLPLLPRRPRGPRGAVLAVLARQALGPAKPSRPGGARTAVPTRRTCDSLLPVCARRPRCAREPAGALGSRVSGLPDVASLPAGTLLPSAPLGTRHALGSSATPHPCRPARAPRTLVTRRPHAALGTGLARRTSGTVGPGETAGPAGINVDVDLARRTVLIIVLDDAERLTHDGQLALQSLHHGTERGVSRGRRWRDRILAAIAARAPLIARLGPRGALLLQPLVGVGLPDAVQEPRALGRLPISRRVLRQHLRL
mmetsp:Transcript_27156/g.68913  ORF Transcript_27156/g.68913 Transcript_27156/m.68913 type:complete len:369 (-) Transcript_27156:211-1317(-)